MRSLNTAAQGLAVALTGAAFFMASDVGEQIYESGFASVDTVKLIELYRYVLYRVGDVCTARDCDGRHKVPATASPDHGS